MEKMTEAVLWDIVYSLLINPIKNRFKKFRIYSIKYRREVFPTFVGIAFGLMMLASHIYVWLWGIFGLLFGALGASLLVINLTKVIVAPLYRKIMKSKEVYLARQVNE